MSKEQSQEYRGNGNHTFEAVDVKSAHFVDRLRVPGGWIYRTTTDCGDSLDGYDFHVNTVFVPMPEVVKHAV